MSVLSLILFPRFCLVEEFARVLDEIRRRVSRLHIMLSRKTAFLQTQELLNVNFILVLD